VLDLLHARRAHSKVHGREQLASMLML